MSWESESSKQSVDYAVLVEVLLDVPVRVHDGVGDLSWNSQAWVGVGHLGSISEITGGVDLDVGDIKLTMSGIPTDFRADLINLSARGKRVNIYHGFRDNAAGAWAHNPELAYAGFIANTELVDQIGADGGASVSIEVNVISALAYVRRLTIYRRSDAHQQDLYAGDLFYSFKADVSNPMATPTTSNPSGASSGGAGGRGGRSLGERVQHV